MTDPQIAVAMLGIFIFTIMLGFPIWITLMAMAIEPGIWRAAICSVKNRRSTRLARSTR